MKISPNLSIFDQYDNISAEKPRYCWSKIELERTNGPDRSLQALRQVEGILPILL